MGIARKVGATALATAGAAALLVLVPSPAQAAVSECTVQYFTTTCSTGTIAASSSHKVLVRTFESPIGNPFCGAGSIRWKVVDKDTGVVVGRGSGHGSWTISGLYGRYYGRLDNCPRMTINISS